MSEGAAPETPQSPAPAPAVEAPVTAPPAVSAPQAEPAAAPAQETPPLATTLLGEVPVSPEPEKPAAPPEPDKKDATPADKAPEPPAEGEPKKEEGNQSDEPAPLPTYEPFTLPEGVTFDEAKLGEFSKELGEFQNLTKADQKAVQEFGQRLVNRHIAELQETTKRIAEAQVAEWDKTKSVWKDTIEKDPELGGNRTETTKTNINRFIQTYGGTAEERKEFSDFMNQTVGNYPPLVRMIAKAGAMLAEGRPLPATTPAPKAAKPGSMARARQMYTG